MNIVYNEVDWSDFMNIVIYGEEKLLMEQKLNALKKQYHIKEEDMNMIVYYANETSLSEIVEDALTPPFFSEFKMIVLKNPYFFTTVKQKEVNETEIKVLMDYLSKDNPSTIFVIYHDVKNFDERKKIVKELRKKVKFFEVDKVDEQKLYQITHQSIKARGASIDDDAIELLLSRSSNNLLEISQEVNKLCLYTKDIKKEDVDKLVPKKLEDNVFELTKAILNKETGKSIQIYRDLKTNNEEPIKLIVLIANSLRLLYQVKLLDRKGYNDSEIGKILGINPYRLKYIRADGKDYEIGELLSALDDLSQLDVKIKTGQIDRFKGLELFLIGRGKGQWNH